MQVNNPQKPKNDTIRLTEPATLDEGVYVVGKMSADETREAIKRLVNKGLMSEEEAAEVGNIADQIPRSIYL